MSAILSADDLNDFINPGVACIKPIETLPKQSSSADSTEGTGNPYEVTTEEHVNANTIAPPAQISLTDCLACSGCVTSAEAVLVSLQSHGEVLDTLDKFPERKLVNQSFATAGLDGMGVGNGGKATKVFVASVSPQSRASVAATYGVSEREAGYMIAQLLSGSAGLRSGGKYGSGFTWVVDTNAMREASLVAAAEEVEGVLSAPAERQKKPVITSACPGWICYAEKTHPHILPHLSRLKSPQALTGVLLKSVLAKRFGVSPDQVWHLAVMPCFDKKLEASRSELTSHTWHGADADAVRDVDCVITARELLMLAESRGINFADLPTQPLAAPYTPPFPEPAIHDFLFSRHRGQKRKREDATAVGTSGGYLHHILQSQQAQHPGSTIRTQRGRNNDVSEYTVVGPDGAAVFKAARYYGFRNIQNLVRRLKPAKASRMPGASASRRVGVARRPNAGASPAGADSEYAYVEVMACPGGCTNGGGQIKVAEVPGLRQAGKSRAGSLETGNGSEGRDAVPDQREWLALVDEAYWSASEEESGVGDEVDGDGDVEMEHSPARDSVISRADEVVNGVDRRAVKEFLDHWATVTGIGLDTLLRTTYRAVESDVGKGSGSDVNRVNALAHAAGGGW